MGASGVIFAVSFNRERVGFRSKHISAVVYLRRGTYEIWLFGRCWANMGCA
jgi:hypothetical protein